MKKILILSLLLTNLFAEAFQVYVSTLESNIYEGGGFIGDESFLIKTRICSNFVFADKAILIVREGNDRIIFSNQMTCQVENVYIKMDK